MFWQRAAVCYLGIIFDLVHTLVFVIYVLAIGAYDHLVPTDFVTLASNLFPLMHILAVARAIEAHGAPAQKLERKKTLLNSIITETKDTTNKDGASSEPLPRKLALGFAVAQVAAIGFIISTNVFMCLFIAHDPRAPRACASKVLTCDVGFGDHVKSLDFSV